MFFKGNQRNLSTYGENRPERVYFIKNSGYEFLTPMHFSSKRPCSFLFIASHGQVHKGLDLVLESFASRPYLELFVCSMFGEEEDFCALYKRELYETPNIHPIGFVDIRGQLFRYIADRCSICDTAVVLGRDFGVRAHRDVGWRDPDREPGVSASRKTKCITFATPRSMKLGSLRINMRVNR